MKRLPRPVFLARAQIAAVSLLGAGLAAVGAPDPAMARATAPVLSAGAPPADLALPLLAAAPAAVLIFLAVEFLSTMKAARAANLDWITDFHVSRALEARDRVRAEKEAAIAMKRRLEAALRAAARPGPDLTKARIARGMSAPAAPSFDAYRFIAHPDRIDLLEDEEA